MASRKAFLGSLPCLQLLCLGSPVTAGFQSPPRVPLPLPDSSMREGWTLVLGSFLCSPISSVSSKSPPCLVLVVPLSPQCGLPRGAGTWQWLLCAAPRCVGVLEPPILIRENLDERTRVPSSTQEPLPGGKGSSFPVLSVGFPGVPGPGAGSTLSNNPEPLGPSRPRFTHELYKNCQS